MTKVWIVEDETNILKMTQMMLERAGYDVQGFESGMSAIEALARLGQAGNGLDVDVILTDFRLHDTTGIEVLKAAKSLDASTQVVLMTAYATTATAVEAMKEGAFDYIEKPFKRDALLSLISKANEKRENSRENRIVQTRNHASACLSNFIANSAPMRSVLDMITRVAPTKANILVFGESGTGKEVVAHAIHQLSTVSDKPFVAVNCGAIPETLIESEFFGYVKGAFTGANRDKQGFFAAANGGTLFLDEIGELPLAMQVKLLRVIQERKLQRVGETTEHPVDVRIIAATNRNLRNEVSEKRFREDLFFRLNVIQIVLPPLRERRSDIPAFLAYFIQKYNADLGQHIRGVTEDVLQCLAQYDFPGNVRELENIIEHAMTLEMSNKITLSSLPPYIVGNVNTKSAADKLLDLCGIAENEDVAYEQMPCDQQEAEPHLTIGNGVDLENIVENLERTLIEQSLEKTHGNVTRAAELLGISFRSLRYRLKKYDIDIEK